MQISDGDVSQGLSSVVLSIACPSPVVANIASRIHGQGNMHNPLSKLDNIAMLSERGDRRFGFDARGLLHRHGIPLGLAGIGVHGPDAAGGMHCGSRPDPSGPTGRASAPHPLLGPYAPRHHHHLMRQCALDGRSLQTISMVWRK